MFYFGAHFTVLDNGGKESLRTVLFQHLSGRADSLAWIWRNNST